MLTGDGELGASYELDAPAYFLCSRLHAGEVAQFGIRGRVAQFPLPPLLD